MTDLQEKSIELWREGYFDLHWKLRTANERIEKLEAALRELDRESEKWIISSYAMFVQTVRNIIRKALEGKDE